ncbi:MAG: membrane dipeptidase [Cyclobacteriaceae bacterium]|jgi:membrane dipeptidase
MIRKIFKRILIFAVIGTILFFFLGGKITDRMKNKTASLEDYPVSQEAISLHRNIRVADLHADNLLWDRDITQKYSHGHVDIERLIEGNFTLQVFDAVIKTPKNLNYLANTDKTDNITLLAMANRWPPKTWFSLLERARHQSAILYGAARESPSLSIITSQSDLNYFLKLRSSNSYLVGGLLSIEGLHALEGELKNLDVLYDDGYRILGLVHFFDNAVGGSSAGVEKTGLTDFGTQVIRIMERKNMIVDLAHASPDLIRDVLAIAKRPVIVSHTGIAGIHTSPRNLTDEQVIGIANTGGLIGIGFWEEALGDLHPSSIARTARYLTDLVGVDHVSLGSDFDGAVETSFDASQIIYVTEALIQEGFTPDEIKQIMGGNIIDFMVKNLPPA